MARRRSFYAVTGVTAVFMAAMLGFALAFPVLAWFPDDLVLELFEVEPDALAHRLHELVIGLFGWALLLGVAVQLHAPERKLAPLLQAAAVPIVLSIVEAINGNLVIADTAPLLLPLLVAVLHPRATGLLHPGRLHPALAGLTALAAVPWLVFVVGQARLQQLAAAGDAHAEAGHWGLMASFGILVLAWGLLGATQLSGWRITGYLAALAAVAYGAHSLVFPQGASAAPTGWALAAVGWGVVYGATVWRRGPAAVAQGDRAAPLVSS